MILKIKLSNFFSIKDEIILDLRAGKIQSKNSQNLSNNIFRFKDIQVLKSVGIYGANASGKSNIIRAIRFCIQMIIYSHTFNEKDIFNFTPFKFDRFHNNPSHFSINFVVNDIEHEYSFSLNGNEIITESLYYYPFNRRVKIFTRDETNGELKRIFIVLVLLFGDLWTLQIIPHAKHYIFHEQVS